MNIIAKAKTAQEVPTPDTGYAVFFIDSADFAPKVKLSNGSVVTLKGDQGVAGVGATKRSTVISFADTSAFQYVTVSDTAVNASSIPTGFVVMPQVDGWDLNYSVKLVSVSTSTFDVEVTASDPHGHSIDGLPMPNVILYYQV